ncbi:aldehyde dehydrogenase (NADP(+)) [Niabella pedocola]|uniref:Aldehyde dehydrogenase (NADP(+)) n=1 Tax=Niabella pedocola TaxID=1752077 RepID=A0ABS8PL48_9BACT|nr:aldehyde dehydrogenase (NADP(+)) [Niabella pedocola]MCD2421829.1 aldehyde dehydrogenase (NADP(+)) [Niabella pedocola]
MMLSQSVLDAYAVSAGSAFQFLKTTTVKERAVFMQAVADQIEALGPELLDAAHRETALPLPRLTGEKARTVGQWRAYADAVAKGLYVEARIDTAHKEKAKNDIRKYSIGLGPVLVFGAGNFPFAFSTAGGDTASAIGAGCPVLVKAHPGHPETSRIMAAAITAVVEASGWPPGVFSHIDGDEVAGTGERTGAYLTAHPQVKAVGFTGSYQGGKALLDIAGRREEPIPVFAEMGSINPVFVFPQALEQGAEALAKEYIASLTLGTGQFCTNPGMVIGVKSAALDRFKQTLRTGIRDILPSVMLNEHIYTNFEKRKTLLSEQPEIHIWAESAIPATGGQGRARVVETTAASFLTNPILGEEVFGPFGILIEAGSWDEVAAVAAQLKGQLTVTLVATAADMDAYKMIIERVKDKAGRLLFNGMPTGVEVVYAMQHGGPFPASTDARFTSVGPDAVKRFVRPVAFQNWPEAYLPEELKDENGLQILRIVNGQLTMEDISSGVCI